MNRRQSLGASLLAGASVVGLTVASASPWRWATSAQLARQATPYSADPPNPARRLLVVGDSTAVGTGASSPAASLPGLIGSEHAEWQIHNLAANGARFADVLDQLAAAETGHDLVLVMAAGNDVIRLTGDSSLRAQVDAVLLQAQHKGRAVTVMPCGDVGHAPMFHAPLAWWFSHRSARLHAIVAAACQRRGTRYVRLLKPRGDDPFVQQAQRLNAADGLHPSDAGYRHWYDELRRQSGLAAITG